MKTLYFEQITDDRFDKDIKNLLIVRIEKLKELLNIDGIEVKIFPIDELHWEEKEYFKPDGSFSYKTEASNQCRCKFEIIKTNRKITWNDIYKIVNSVNAVPYKFY